jgi:integrase
VGLVSPREAPQQSRLGEFLESYIAGRTDVKPRTRINLEAAQRRLLEYFGADRPLAEITAADATDWEIRLKARHARGTIGRTIKRAKQFFQAAIDGERIGKNPFAKIKPPSQVNEAGKFFVTLEAASKVLAACPDAEWRLLFALSRFGSLRCPSEHLALTWPDVDWERDRFRVVSSKKEHLEGGGVRWVPIFPELRPYLEEAFELTPEGSAYVIRRYRDSNANLRTQLNRIIRRAGLEPWPKLFQNLRATRETEMTEAYPLYVVCAWIGNTAVIAQKHYLQVTDDYFTLAAQTDSAPNSAPNAKTAQNTAQHRTRTERKNPGFYGVFCEFPWIF